MRHERLVWFEKPSSDPRAPAPRTFNAQEAAEHYSEEDRAVALAKGKGRVTEASLDKGRPPRTYIDIPRLNSRSVERKQGARPSMKPLGLCERLLRVHSNPGDTVLVPFGGSGSELLAAAKLGRLGVGFETEADYVALARRRFEAHAAPLELTAASRAPAAPP